MTKLNEIEAMFLAIKEWEGGPATQIAENHALLIRAVRQLGEIAMLVADNVGKPISDAGIDPDVLELLEEG